MAEVTMPMPARKTARVALIERLKESQTPLAVHELAILAHSENALATELSIMARQGLTVGVYREGKRFKEWSLTDKGRA